MRMSHKVGEKWGGVRIKWCQNGGECWGGGGLGGKAEPEGEGSCVVSPSSCGQAASHWAPTPPPR